MDKKESILFAREIASRIAANALYADYPKELRGEAAVDFVIGELNRAIMLEERSGRDYVDLLRANAKELDPRELAGDPYMRKIRIEECSIGDFRLTYSEYDRGELIQYAMPDLSADIVVPKIGFYPEKVSFPVIYEGNLPWVSVCPSEISSMRRSIEQARGNVLTLGCGLGYYAFMVSEKEEVESVTIVELREEVVQLFKEKILPQFTHPEKVRIIRADAFEFVEQLTDDQYDMCFADIWEGPEDGAPAYMRLREAAKRHRGIQFSYWIEEEIRRWLVNEYA